MKKLSMMLLFLLLGLFLMAVGAWATPINDNRPFSAFGTSGEPSLQEIFDSNLLLQGGGSLDAVNDQSDAALWIESGDGDVDSYLVSMFRGDAGTLGIYSEETGAEYDLPISSSGQASFLINDSGALWLGNTLVNSNFGPVFGFYWRDTTVPFVSYTEDDKNSQGYGDDSNILALTYLLPEGTIAQTMAYGGTTLSNVGGDDWILAFEDRANGDGDFNDAVFLVEDMKAVPEPATMLLFGVGLCGLAFVGRKKLIKHG
jgi:hypothetical protein